MTKFKKLISLGLAVCLAAFFGVLMVACSTTPDEPDKPADNIPPASTSYVVSFNMQGHGAAPTAQSVKDGEYATKPATDPTADGYDFGGWYKEAACTTVFVFANEKITADTVVYAKWTEAEEQEDPTAPTEYAATYHVYNSGYMGSVNGDAYSPENIWHYENAFRPDDPAIDYTYSVVTIAANSAVQIFWHLDGCEADTQYKFDIREGENFAQNSEIRQNFECWSAVGMQSALEYNIWNRNFGLIGLQISFTEEQLTGNGAMCKVILQNPTDTAYTLRIICAVGDAH